MSRAVWKYEINGVNPTTLPIPQWEYGMPAPVLHVGTQHGRWFAWMEVEPYRPTTSRTFKVFATGEEIPSLPLGKWQWVWTWQDEGFVWHLYEKVEYP